jgi:hypothetical protein
MMTRSRVFAGLLLLLACPVAADTAAAGLKWYRGNLHTHTKISDGNTSPGAVAQWYRDNDYDFLSLTDHNKLADPDAAAAEMPPRADPKKNKPFLLIPGEELSDGYKTGNRGHALHYTVLGISRVIEPQGGKDFNEVTARSMKAVADVGGMLILNHPNFVWSVTADDIKGFGDLTHFEVWNAVPVVNNLGGVDAPSTEEMWDSVLSTGRQLYGIAGDDAHDFITMGHKRGNPGRAWMGVRAGELTTTGIVSALKSGDFYCSSGVEFDDIATTGNTLGLRIRKIPTFPGWEERYRTTFIGKNGRVLKTDGSMTPSYKLKPGDLYVRARVVSSNGFLAWSQPLFRGGK